MPTPVYTGTYPVTLKEVFDTRIDGSRFYSLTQAWKNEAGICYGCIGTPTLVDGFTHYESSNSSSGKDGIVEITRVFAYAPQTQQSFDSSVEYYCTASASEEPIQAHPAFLTATAGFETSIVTASGGYLTDSTSGGAVFDQDGIFLGFNKDATNNLSGVASYLSPQVSFTRKYSTKQRPPNQLTQAIGTIRYPTAGPTVAYGKDWLLTDVNWSNAGSGDLGIYEISEAFRLSGEGGWSKFIYFES